MALRPTVDAAGCHGDAYHWHHEATLPLIDIPEPTSDEESDGSETEAKADDGLGQESAQAINVIVIADLDFAHDQFFVFYRNVGGQFSDDLAILSQLENIQFAANATDSLTGSYLCSAAPSSHSVAL